MLSAPGKLRATFDVHRLFPDSKEAEDFHGRLRRFVSSPGNDADILSVGADCVSYGSEQIVPSLRDDRPALLMVFGNPAPHSVAERRRHAGLEALARLAVLRAELRQAGYPSADAVRLVREGRDELERRSAL